MSGVQRPGVRPESHFLMPIGDREMDLAPLLSSHPALRKYSQTSMQFGNTIKWYNQSYHALVFGPSPEHELSEGGVWSPSSDFSSLHGKARHLFFEDGERLLYAGFYRCFTAHEWSEEGALCPSEGKMIRTIVDAPRPPGNIVHKYGKQKVTQMYQNGILRLDCMILQCVGFDHALYNKLLHLYKKPALNKRNKQHQGGPPNKKVKVNSSMV